MTGCHDCPVAAAIGSGEFKNTDWADIPCSTCTVVDKEGFVMELDEERISGDASTGEAEIPEVYERTVLPVDVMRDCVAGLLSLPPELRDVVAWRYAGMQYDEIAALQGVTMAAAEKRHRKAMSIWPGLKALFPEKIAKQKRRKKHEKVAG